MTAYTMTRGKWREAAAVRPPATLSPDMIRQATLLRPRPIPLLQARHTTARQRIRDNCLRAADGVPTVIVAAHDSPYWMKRAADFICTGVDDDQVVQAAIDLLPEG